MCIPISDAKQGCLSQPCTGSEWSPGGTVLSDTPPPPTPLFSTARNDWSQRGDFHTSLEPSVQLYTAINPNQSDLKGSASFNHLGMLRFVSVNRVLPYAREKQGDGVMGNDAEMRPRVLKSNSSSPVLKPWGRPGG